MSRSQRRRNPSPLQAWAGDSRGRQFAVRLLRNVVAEAVLVIGVVVILQVLVPNMIHRVTNQLVGP